MTWCDIAEKDPIIATHAQVVDLAAQYMNILSDRKGDKGRGAISGSVDKQLRYIDCSGERGEGRLDASLFMMLLLGRGGD